MRGFGKACVGMEGQCVDSLIPGDFQGSFGSLGIAAHVEEIQTLSAPFGKLRAQDRPSLRVVWNASLFEQLSSPPLVRPLDKFGLGPTASSQARKLEKNRRKPKVDLFEQND